MKTPSLSVLIAVPALLAGSFVFAALEAASMPALLPVGMAGLGTLTLASERWRHAGDAPDPAPPGCAREGTLPPRPDAGS